MKFSLGIGHNSAPFLGKTDSGIGYWLMGERIHDGSRYGNRLSGSGLKEYDRYPQKYDLFYSRNWVRFLIH
jgi:hypothetical protein